MNFKMFDDVLTVPERNETVSVIKEFLKSDKKSLVVTFSTLDEAKKGYACASQYKKNHNLNVCVWKRRCEVYIIKC